MSALSRFMSTARGILDEKPAPKAQPPFFVRTTWLFAELEELATPDEIETFMAIKIACLQCNVAKIAPLIEVIAINSERLTDGRQRHERKQLCAWIKEQIARDGLK
jgi:hypothetical protein